MGWGGFGGGFRPEGPELRAGGPGFRAEGPEIPAPEGPEIPAPEGPEIPARRAGNPGPRRSRASGPTPFLSPSPFFRFFYLFSHPFFAFQGFGAHVEVGSLFEGASF